jgi:hypothetical protein
VHDGTRQTPQHHNKESAISISGSVGGDQDLRPGNCYYDAMALIMNWAMQDFDAVKEVFPMHFTCLGWESVAVAITHNPYILSTPLSLKAAFVCPGSKAELTIHDCSDDVLTDLQTLHVFSTGLKFVS